MKAKFVLFCIGLAVAIGSSLTSFYFLYSSLLGISTLVYEPNSSFAILEMIGLVLAFASCISASEIYYRYLELKNRIYSE